MIFNRRLLRGTSLLVLGVLLLSSTASGRASGATPNQVIPGITETQPWLDQQLVQWAPGSIYKMSFGAPALALSYGNIYANTSTPQVINADLGMIEQTGGKLVRFDMSYDAWLASDTKTIQAFGNYVQMVNSSGTLIVIADSSAERYRSFPQTWDNFQLAWLQRVKTLASLYHPYAYIVVKEPGWYYPMISDLKTNPTVYDANSWGNLTQALVTAVKSVSPNTRVGVSVAAFDLYNDSAYQGKVSFNVQFLQRAEKISNLDFIGFDIYDIAGFLGTQHFLSQYGNAGKAVWIAEAWSGDQINLSDPSRAQLDVTWIQVLYYFALHVHAEAVLPFYSDLLASYETPPTNAAGMLQFYQQRTPVFYEFQKVISTNALEVPLNSTTISSTTSSSTVSNVTQSASSGSSSASSLVSATSSGQPSAGSTSSSIAVSNGSNKSGSNSSAALVGVVVLVGLVLIVAGIFFARRGASLHLPLQQGAKQGNSYRSEGLLAVGFVFGVIVSVGYIVLAWGLPLSYYTGSDALVRNAPGYAVLVAILAIGLLTLRRK